MSMDITFFNITKHGLECRGFGFTNDGFKLLIDSGLFKLPHVPVSFPLVNGDSEQLSAIDLKMNRKEVYVIFTAYALPHPELQEIITSVNNYEYLGVF